AFLHGPNSTFVSDAVGARIRELSQGTAGGPVWSKERRHLLLYLTGRCLVSPLEGFVSLESDGSFTKPLPLRRSRNCQVEFCGGCFGRPSWAPDRKRLACDNEFDG